MATASQLQQLYVAYFGRAADPSGLDYWVAQGTTTKAFAAHMHGQNEFQSTYGTKSNEAQVNQIYQNLFNRDADAAGLLYWVGQIENGTLSLASIANDLIWNIDNGHGSATDKLTLAAKTSTATSYTAEIRKSTAAILAYQPDSTDPWTSGTDFEAAVTFMNTATSTNTPTAAEITASVTSISADDEGTGSTITLTSSSDVKNGTTGNDIFYALNAGDLSSSDVIDGKGGSADKIIAAQNSATTLRPILKNIETVVIEGVNANAGTNEDLTINLDQSSSVTKVEIKNYASDDTDDDTFKVEGISTSTGVTLTDATSNSATTSDNNLTITYDAVTGTADSSTITLNSNTTATTFGTITAAGIETLTIDAIGGTDSTYALTAAAATTLNITAAAGSGGTASVTAGNATAVNITAADDFTLTDTSLGKVFTYTIDSTLAAVGTTAASTVTATDITPTVTTGSDTLKFTVKGAGLATIDSDANWGVQSVANGDTIEVDASANTGGVTVNFGGYGTNNARYNKFTGGSGADEAQILQGGLDKYDTIALGTGTDTITSTASYTSNAASNLFYTDTLTSANQPTISGVEIAKIVLSDSGAASTVTATSASFASTLQLDGDVDNAKATISSIPSTVTTIKLGKTLDLTDAGSGLDLVYKDASATAPTASMTITSDLLESGTATIANIDDLQADEVTSVTLGLDSTDTDVTKVTLDGASFDKASSVTITSAEKVTIGSIDALEDATLDFTGVAGELDVTVDNGQDYTVKGAATAKSTIRMGAANGLDKDDNIQGGSGTTDVLIAEINGLANSTTSTTGALTISGIETIELDVVTATSSLDFSGVTGATTVAVGSGGAGIDLVIDKLTAGTAIQYGVTASSDYTGDLEVKLADATGSSDSLTINLAARGSDDEVDGTLTTTGIETVTINDLSTNTNQILHSATSNTSIVDFTSDSVLTLRGDSSALLSLKSATLSNTAALTDEVAAITVGDNKLVLAEAASKTTIDTAADIIASTADDRLLGALDFSAAADAFLLIGGADDDTTQFLYKIDNDNIAALATGEVTLVGTITTDITNGMAGYTTENFGFGEDIELDVSAVDASKLVLTGGYSTEAFDLTVQGAGSLLLNAATTTVDASALKSLLTASAAADTATTFSTFDAVGTVTGSSAGDTFTVGTTANYVDSSVGTIEGGLSADTLTAYLTDSGSIAAVNSVETVNINVGGLTGTTSTVTIAAANKGINDASSVVITGGLAGNVTTLDGSITKHGHTLDASAFVGSVAITYGDGGLVQAGASDAITIKGALGTSDKVTVSADADNSGDFTMTGVETLVFGVDTGASTLNLANVTGLTGITITDDNSTAHNVTITNAPVGVPIDIGVSGGYDYSAGNAKIDYNLTTSTGSSDSATFNLVNLLNVDLDTDGIETVNLVAKELGSGQTDTVSIAASNVTAGTINVSGTDADDDVTLDSIATGYTTVSATGLKGDLTIAASTRGSAAMTLTGGSGADSLAMESANDVIDGGSGSDTLVVSGSFGSGGITVDLSLTGDQLTTFIGTTNTVVQKNFENVDLSAYTLATGVGSTITGTTGNNTLTGSPYNDVIIANGGTDTIYGKEGADTVQVVTGDVSTVYGGAGGDGLSVTGGTAVLYGGLAADTITLTAAGTAAYDHATAFVATESDSVVSFTDGTDKIGLKGIGTDDFALVTDAQSNAAALTDEVAVITLADNKVLLAEATTAATIDTEAEIIASLADDKILGAVDVSKAADAWILIGGANDDSTQYLYKIDNDNIAAIATGEIALVATITSDFTDGIDDIVAADFDFTL